MSRLTRFLPLLLALFFAVSANAQADTSEELANFKVEIIRTVNGLALKGNNGTAWEELEMSLRPYQPQTIDFYGMSGNDREDSDELQDSPFLFVVQKTDVGVKLEGVKGTAWEELSFTLPAEKSVTFDQFGMN